jgi:phosphoserine aminotransferase
MSTASTARIFNFSAGPAVLPLPVLEQAQRELVSLPGVGMSVMEISHRSKAFETLLDTAVADIRGLAGIPEDYSILMLQGGASLQFSMVPMNLLSPGTTADYIDTGSWAEKAAKEAARVGTVNVTGSTKADNYSRLPKPGEIALTPGAAYVHITTNNTIEGTEWLTPPEVGSAPLVADASSDIFSQPIDISRFGVVYAGAQKNLGPSGVTLVIIRRDLLARSSKTLPTMLSYQVMAENNSLYNTPNTFGVYILGLTMKWLKSLGGLAAIGQLNARKASLLYGEIDRTGFYRGTAQPDSRSRMNVTFRLPSEELEKRFEKEATAAGLDGLKGHRSVGGMRASIYNAFPEAGVDALVQFMREFERKNG